MGAIMQKKSALLTQWVWNKKKKCMKNLLKLTVQNDMFWVDQKKHFKPHHTCLKETNKWCHHDYKGWIYDCVSNAYYFDMNYVL